MQYDSRNRLAHLAQVKDARHGASRALWDQIETLRQRHSRADARLRELRASWQGTGEAATEEAATKAEQEIADLTAEIAALTARHDRAADEWRTAARTHENALRYARDHGLPVPVLDDEGGATWAPAGGRS